jgi:hypothetical protein
MIIAPFSKAGIIAADEYSGFWDGGLYENSLGSDTVKTDRGAFEQKAIRSGEPRTV